jgi:hypothetical protein
MTPLMEAAIAFVAARPGGAERILEKHYSARGLCAGCSSVVPVRHPCTLARIAELAKQRGRS